MRRVLLVLVISACGTPPATQPPVSTTPTPVAAAAPASDANAQQQPATTEPPAPPATSEAPATKPAEEALPPPERFVPKSALVTHDTLVGKDYVTLYEEAFTCNTRARLLRAAGVRKFDVEITWKKGFTWKVDPEAPRHPARFTVYTQNTERPEAEASAGSWDPSEGEVEVMSASAKRGRVKVRLVTPKVFVDTTVDAVVCR
ncbi:MAG: hypothetical protein HOV81_15185 [Kofleriaceae bacterium]|nr:hypothetical protein [Kofleriaceae bacterium]